MTIVSEFILKIFVPRLANFNRVSADLLIKLLVQKDVGRLPLLAPFFYHFDVNGREIIRLVNMAKLVQRVLHRQSFKLVNRLVPTVVQGTVSGGLLHTDLYGGTQIGVHRGLDFAHHSRVESRVVQVQLLPRLLVCSMPLEEALFRVLVLIGRCMLSTFRFYLSHYPFERGFRCPRDCRAVNLVMHRFSRIG